MLYTSNMVKKALLSFLMLISISLSLPFSLFAADNANNKFGIYITDMNEAQKASELVNSNGGEWGYVSFIINSNDRQVRKWQERMNLLNDKKLIPIVRIATYGNGDTWMKPVKDDAHDWAVFLSSLYWPTKKKIVVVYNEPNHGYEWGGSTNPAEYAHVLNETIDALKAADKDFVVLNAGFDASAPQEPPQYMDQVKFMEEMENAVPGIFSKLDGWSSHSYPNPGFSGSVKDTGRGSIQTYKWELELLRNKFHVSTSLPVYITETGWVSKNADYPRLKYDENQTAQFMVDAYEKVWRADDQVQAVTPFMLVYKQPLFSHFSWLRADDTETPTFSAVKALTKEKGQVEQIYRSAITSVSVPSQLQKGREVIGTIAFRNTGNAIWEDGQAITLTATDPDGLIIRDNFHDFDAKRIFPGQSFVYRFTVYRDDLLRRTTVSFQMRKDLTVFGEKVSVPVKIFQPPTLTVAVVNPPSKGLKNISANFSNLRDSDDINDLTISPKGDVGTFTSYAFVPGENVSVRLQAPNRDPAVVTVKIEEGSNFASIILPPEYPFWKQIFQLVYGWSNSS